MLAYQYAISILTTYPALSVNCRVITSRGRIWRENNRVAIEKGVTEELEDGVEGGGRWGLIGARDPLPEQPLQHSLVDTNCMLGYPGISRARGELGVWAHDVRLVHENHGYRDEGTKGINASRRTILSEPIQTWCQRPALIIQLFPGG
jgi:hypothetical protein